jgi:hypothetical protein
MAEDVEIAVAAARDAFSRDGGRHWSRASGAVRANFLRAIAAKVPTFCPVTTISRVCWSREHLAAV